MTLAAITDLLGVPAGNQTLNANIIINCNNYCMVTIHSSFTRDTAQKNSQLLVPKDSGNGRLCVNRPKSASTREGAGPLAAYQRFNTSASPDALRAFKFVLGSEGTRKKEG